VKFGLFIDYLGIMEAFYEVLGSDCDYIKWHKITIEIGIKNSENSIHVLKNMHGW